MTSAKKKGKKTMKKVQKFLATPKGQAITLAASFGITLLIGLLTLPPGVDVNNFMIGFLYGTVITGIIFAVVIAVAMKYLRKWLAKRKKAQDARKEEKAVEKMETMEKVLIPQIYKDVYLNPPEAIAHLQPLYPIAEED